MTRIDDECRHGHARDAIDVPLGRSAKSMGRGFLANARIAIPHARPGTLLPWAQYDSSAGKVRQRRLVPDAILELPSVRRRFFVECEMGTHSIVAASDEKTGATLSKVERYDEFFAGYTVTSERLTFYRKSYPDQWPAEVLFLVRKTRRRDAVNAAIESWKQGRTGCAVVARAVTVQDAVSDLSRLLPAPAAAKLNQRVLTAGWQGTD